jgi:hypothetical protein
MTVWDTPLLDSLFRQPVEDSLGVLLLRDMCLIADAQGHAPLNTLAQRFRNFFRRRRSEGKQEERADVLAGTLFSDQTVEWCEHKIVESALPHVSQFLRAEGADIAFRPDTWSGWSPGFRKAVRHMTDIRLIEYFDTRVEGGW